MLLFWSVMSSRWSFCLPFPMMLPCFGSSCCRFLLVKLNSWDLAWRPPLLYLFWCFCFSCISLIQQFSGCLFFLSLSRTVLISFISSLAPIRLSPWCISYAKGLTRLQFYVLTYKYVPSVWFIVNMKIHLCSFPYLLTFSYFVVGSFFHNLWLVNYHHSPPSMELKKKTKLSLFICCSSV